MIAIEHSDDNRKLLIRASGRLSAGDYEAALPELRHAMAVAPGPLRVLVRLEGFEGWEFSAFWKEIEWTLTRSGGLGRVAIVGETRTEEWGTKLANLVTGTEMRFFPLDREAMAEHWLDED